MSEINEAENYGRAKISDVREWAEAKKDTPESLEIAGRILDDVIRGEDVFKAIRNHPIPRRGHISKSTLIKVYRARVAAGKMAEDAGLFAKLRMKPTRTLSGVTTVTVLTKPFPCPGECIFCPNDSRMPKSYLPDEPGAARAYQNEFDPFRQVRSRILAYEAVGHPTDKIELLVLGGSWTSYAPEYRGWFIRRCFDALNGIGGSDGGAESDSLEAAQRRNESASHRNVGLVVETRPDELNSDTLKELRRLGVTKIQLGIQSLDDRLLTLNRRGHSVQEALNAVALCRAAGFKIVLHWMPNLLGATPESDREDFARLWSADRGGLGFCPDEIKIYPTQLVENADLYREWVEGRYRPYDTETLIELIAAIKPTIPPYCRVNRVIRDIPSHHVVAGNTRTSLRMDIQKRVRENGQRCGCIRCREVKGEAVARERLTLVDTVYEAVHAEEHFLQFVTADDKLAGYLRLSLAKPNRPDTGIEELSGASIIREIHIYGQSLAVGEEAEGAAQHIGLGRFLIERAVEITRENGLEKIAVIAAVGTRGYYRKRGFNQGQYYMIRNVSSK